MKTNVYKTNLLSIFICDYVFHKERMDLLREELMKKVFHPKRLQYYLD